MEELTINLQEGMPKTGINKYHKYFYLILGLSWIAVGVMYAVQAGEITWFSGIYLVGGVFFAFYFRWFPKLADQYRLRFNDEGVEVQQNPLKRTVYSWDNVTRIEIAVLEVKIHLDDGRTDSVGLGALSYQTVRQVKLDIRRYLEQYQIPTDQAATVENS